MSVLLYAHVDAPTPPQEIIDRAFAIKAAPTKSETYRFDEKRNSLRTLVKDGKEYINAFTNTNLIDNDFAKKWVQENITDVFNDVRISLTTIGNNMNGPHIDITRDYTLLYLLDNGGPDHETVFYKERGSDELVKPRGYHVDNYDNIEPVIRCKLETNRWHLVCANVLHSIENIPNGRLSIQVSFDREPNLKVHTKIYG